MHELSCPVKMLQYEVNEDCVLTRIERRRIDILEIAQVDNDRTLLGASSDGLIDLPTHILGMRNSF